MRRSTRQEVLAVLGLIDVGTPEIYVRRSLPDWPRCLPEGHLSVQPRRDRAMGWDSWSSQGEQGTAVTMPVRRDAKRGAWFFRAIVKTPDGK
jgi:hypothetical protein